jgi:hypothetical protein
MPRRKGTRVRDVDALDSGRTPRYVNFEGEKVPWDELTSEERAAHEDGAAWIEVFNTDDEEDEDEF